MRKILCMTLALVMCLSLITIPALAAGETVSLDVTIRDFNAADNTILFENREVGGVREGLVETKLGADRKPVFTDKWFADWQGSTQAMLDAFFNDVPGVNMATTKQLTLTADSENYYVIDATHGTGSGYFPIDNELFGNEGRNHNFHFSLEAHASFNYRGFEEFEFNGDDDVWVFVDNTLIIDLGGVHYAETKKVSLPELVKEGILDIKVGDNVNFDFFFMERCTTLSNLYIRTNIDFTYKPISSEWATEELQKADDLGLIPDNLRGEDLTKPITRAEFAAVSVNAYEALSGTAAIPAVNNPFTDTNDVEVLKAYNVGITGGTSATTFDPNTLLNREQAATMLTRVFKKVSLAGWTLATDADFTLDYTKPAPFADDNDISDYAKDSVYFMAANGIITGTGSNMFSPKAVTPEQQAQGYAQATREQALIIAVRMVENLK